MKVPRVAALSLPSIVPKFESFLANPGAICLLVGPAGIGKSTLVFSVCKEESIEVIEYMGDEISHFEEFCLECSKNIGSLEMEQSKGAKKKNNLTKKSSSSSKSSFSFSSSSSSSSSAMKRRRKQIYLVHQLPCASPSDPSNVRTHEALQTFNRGRGKMVVVHSEEGEGTMGPKDIERLVGGVPCQVIQCNKVGVRAMRRIVGGVVPKKEVNGIVDSADGDVRRALILAQTGGGKRDTKLSHFHALGKLLYCKRGEDGTLNEADPEMVVERSDMGQEGLQAFLQMHCVEFFTELDELSEALAGFSDSELFESKLYTTPSDNLFPRAYSASFMARAVSANLKHKAEHKFKMFNKPKCWDVGRKVREEKQAWKGVGGFNQYVIEEREMKVGEGGARGEEGKGGGLKEVDLSVDDIVDDSDDNF